MSLRRKQDLQRIRMARRNLPTVTTDMAEEVIRLRRAMHRAMGQLDAGVPREARATLRVALQERWWR